MLDDKESVEKVKGESECASHLFAGEINQ